MNGNMRCGRGAIGWGASDATKLTDVCKLSELCFGLEDNLAHRIREEKRGVQNGIEVDVAHIETSLLIELLEDFSEARVIDGREALEKHQLAMEGYQALFQTQQIGSGDVARCENGDHLG